VLKAGITAALVRLFEHQSNDCHPIAIKERRYSNNEIYFISVEAKRLFDEGLLDANNSPWRAQLLVVAQESHKKYIISYYSQTINKFTQLNI